MLSETPATIPISLEPAAVCTSDTINGGKRLCSWRAALSSCSVQTSFMFFTLAGVMNFSFRCHDVRCGSAPSVSQFPFAWLGPCACGTPVQTAAAHSATAAPIDLRITDGLLPEVPSPSPECQSRVPSPLDRKSPSLSSVFVPRT